MAGPKDSEKAMSSRLLTMKFMQRAGANSQTPSKSTGNHPSKRMRLSNGTASPVTPSSALEDTPDPDEIRRLKALEKHAEAVGETRWVLSVQETPRTANETFNVVTASYGDIDALSDNEAQEQASAGAAEDAPAVGRRVFGKMKKRPSEARPQESSDSDGSSSSSDDDEDDDDPAAQLIRAERREAAAQARERRRAKRKAEQADADKMAADRRKKEIKLNKLTSISGGGGSKSGSRSGASTPSKEIKCYKCGRVGHTKAMCPTRRSLALTLAHDS